jgi:hypothetical protein
MKPFRLSATLLAIVSILLVVGSTTANAQNNCAPFSGTVYGALYRDAPDQPRTWHMLGNFTIGRDLSFATVGVKSTSLARDPDTWQGTELWTFDFGGGHTIQLATDFVTEHMTNAAGIYHIREVGRFVNGTGAFVHAYGNLTAEGPFGPGVVLHDVPGLPTVATMFWVAPTQGMICGKNKREK